ncbi:MAG: hypothetical protein JOZ39_04620, partial [Chloroflexi bacterium]|nr:hypothetical protein [Chloroflexota bacterium]
MANLRRARARSGTGSVIFEDSKKLWKGRIRIDGKVVTYYGKTQAEAAEKLDDAIQNAEDGRPIATAHDRKRTVGEWLAEWLAG